MTVEDLFLAALDIPDETERSSYLAQMCGDDEALRQELHELLSSHSRSGHFLDVPVAEQMRRQSVEPSPADELLGTILDGKYQLGETLGEGGMGTVLSARQLAPMIRKVAVKVVKAGMDSKAVLARFEAERQAIAVMDHPNIAKVLDAGTTPGGRPYFVMEQVEGVPLTDYCDAKKLNLRERLALFIPVCQAIQHAHQKGIIHRDIKPSNVLVAEYDGQPVPKVIDFGVAKAVVGPEFSDHTKMTAHGMIVGTPEYMSPEQAGLNPLDIDTRSDVYSLGVLLYELLTGSTPVDSASLHEAGFLEILRIVREVEAPKPSTKLSTLGNLQNVAANRRMQPAHLSKLLVGELDWVVLKAIEKDRTRRYETANALSRDIQRFLADEFVEARPPSRRYRVKKFLRRHRGPVIAAGLVLATLFAGLIGTTWQAIRAENALARERGATELTASRLQQIETINNTVFDIFGEFDLRKVRSGNEPIEQVLAQKLIAAGQKLDTNAIHDPLVLANLQSRLGITLVNLGHPRDAIAFLKSAREIRLGQLGPDAPETLDSTSDLSVAHREAGQFDLALPLAEETLARCRATLGVDHGSTLTSQNNLAMLHKVMGKLDLAIPLYEATLAQHRANPNPDDSHLFVTMNNLAIAYRAVGKLELALPLYEQAFTLRKASHGADHPDTLTSQNNLAMGYKAAGKPDQALLLFEEVLRLRKAKLGADHPDTFTSMSNLAGAYRGADSSERAIPLYEETLTRIRAKLGGDHPETLTVMNNLAVAYKRSGKLDLALPLYEETLKLRKARLGMDHASTLISMNNLAAGYQATGKLEQAVVLLEQTFTLERAKFSPDHPSLQIARKNLARVYEDTRQFASAEVLHREQLALVQQKFGVNSTASADAMRTLAENLMHQKKWPEAERILRDSLTIAEQNDSTSFGTAHAQSLLGGTLLAQKKHADAEPVLQASFTRFKQLEKKSPSRCRDRLRTTIHELIELYRETNQPTQARKWQAEAAKYREAAPRPREAS